MSGQAQEALKVYERMLTAGALPTATTYTALISAYGKNGQLDRALQIFDDMVRMLSDVDGAITFTALTTAYGKTGQLDRASYISDSMVRSLPPFDTVVRACLTDLL